MHYVKNLFINFLAAFFSNYLFPGLHIIHPSRIPHIGIDLIFPFCLSVLNASIFPILKLTRQGASAVRLILIAFILNFAAYGLLKIVHLGIMIESLEGYILASSLTAIASFCTNYYSSKNHHVPSGP